MRQEKDGVALAVVMKLSSALKVSVEEHRDSLGEAGGGLGGLSCGDEAESSLLKV